LRQHGKARNHRRYVLVTGGAGFIGSYLVERLLNEGEKVVVIDDLSTGNLNNLRAARRQAGLKIVTGKISACPHLDALARAAKCIFHLAAAVGVELVVHSPIRAIHTNLYETEVLLEAACSGLTPVLIASTSEVYGKSRKNGFVETDDLIIGPPNLGRWSYACSKLMDEFLALAYAQERGLPVIIARLFNTVGPRQTGRYGMVLPRFIAAAKAGKPIEVYGDGRQTRCFCHVHDTVEALMRLQRCPAARGQVVNVGGAEEISIRALARLVKKICRSPSPIKIIPYSRVYPRGFEDMQRRKPILKRLQNLTGFRPRVALPEIIRHTAEAD
jgi:UDP-glucose 4-epimerase